MKTDPALQTPEQTMPEETKPSLCLELSCLPVVNYAMQQNGFPIVRSVCVENQTETELAHALLRITAAPAFAPVFEREITRIPPKARFQVQGIDLVSDGPYLASLTEKVAGTLTAELFDGEVLLCRETVPISVLTFHEWHGYAILPELLTAFVTPNNPAVGKIISRAVAFLEEWTGDPSLDGYQSKNTNRVLSQAAAIYKALQEQNIVYAEPPASFEAVGQKVRLCDEVLSQKMGTCLDLTLLYASCLESVGLHPLLILQKGHIFAGVWLEEATFPESVQDDVSLLTKRLAEGSQVLAVVECTLFTAGKHAGFDDACRAAALRLGIQDAFECLIDVKRARLSRITPLPTRILTADGWRVERPEVAEKLLTPAPEQVSAPIDVAHAGPMEFTKKALWERKLLDLGMRNSLLNLRLTRTTIPLLISSLDDLEDALAAGGDFTVRPRPADWMPPEGRIGLENLHMVDGVTALLQSEFRNRRLRSALTESELENALKQLYRTARTEMEENGANSLYLALGLLKWYESSRSTQARYAPLLLVPIEMVRKSAAEGYVIRLRDDETQMNITLLEKLRQDFSIEIGGLDPLPTDESGVDTRRVFATLRHGILEQKRWDVLESACLGSFSFSRFVMWNDIHNRADDLARSKVVRSLMEGHLTWQAEAMESEGSVPEDSVLLPIPADASQLFAIESAVDGKSFVLHGPPGTGKSQTITALIANVLAQGKTVLFVAEKMAALEVVQKRLAAIGLSPFCLELHSNKAKKRDVLEQLRQASEVGKYSSSGAYEASQRRIQTLRTQLNQYAAALHRQQRCGKTLYTLINEYQSVQAAPDITGFSDEFFDGITEECLYDLRLLVQRLVNAGRETGHPHNHPLTDVGCKSWSQQLRRSALEQAKSFRDSLDVFRIQVNRLSEALSPVKAITLEELEQLSRIARCLTAFTDLPRAWVEAENLSAYLEQVQALCEQKNRMRTCRDSLTARWTDTVLEMDGQALLEEYELQSGKWFLGRLLGLRKLRQQLAHAAKGTISDETLAEDLHILADYQQAKQAADALFAQVGQGLDDLYRGEQTDWAAVAALAVQAQAAADEARAVSGDDALRKQYGTQAQTQAVARDYLAAWDRVRQNCAGFDTLLEVQEQREGDWIALRMAQCDRVAAHAEELREWVLWNRAAEDASQAGLTPVVEAYRSGLEHDLVVPACEKAVLRGLAVHAMEADEALNCFSGKDFNEKIAQFRRIDSELTELARSEIYCRLAAQVPNFTAASVGSSETGILQRAIRSGGRGVSIRRLFEQIPNLLPKLCPCMLMSPISVAQYLDPNRKPFDLVVFDEASQLPTSKAIGALARGENAVVVGDPKQMPPTSFFATAATDEDHLEDEDLESILDDCLALNMPQTHLLWHYRSRHESLIAFSNSHFYDNQLYTFPSVNDRETHVHLVHVDGVFERGGKRTNQAEAEAVIDELKRRAHDPVCCVQSVGVVTFNISQQNLIEDLLTEACKTDALLDWWAYGGEEPLFIKNLENVQGDERDVILFSVGYGPDQNGRVSMNFGPLNREGGWRRLNVAVSRARAEMVIYATLTPDQIDLSRTSAEGVATLKEFLSFAAGRPLAETEESASSAGAAGIADAICTALREQGYETDCGIGESTYKIDIGVIDPQNPEQYLLGILLDGPGYAMAKTTRDREVAQVDVLRGLGWRMTRVWSMDWWDNSKKEIERLLTLLHRAEEERTATEQESATALKPEDADQTEQELHVPEVPETLDGVRLKGVVHKTERTRQSAPVYQAAKLESTPMSAEAFIVPERRHYRKLAEKIEAVVEAEGPISESLLTRRVIQSYSIARAGGRIQSFLAMVFKELKFPVTTQGEDRFYWAASQNPETYRAFRTNGEGENRRSAKEIPVQEAANAVCSALEEQFSLPQEDLIRAAAKQMGISRIGPAVKALVQSGMEYAQEQGRIHPSDNGNWMLQSDNKG